MTTPTLPLAERIAVQIDSYLSEAPSAVVIEDGAVIFDFSTARYSLNPERDKCVLQIWSEERNIVRRVVAAELKQGILKLSVTRLGQPKPTRLEICADTDRRTVSARRATRAHYVRTLQRTIDRSFPGWTVDKLVAAADLEHSFGPAYVRGLLKRGQSRLAVVGVGSAETQATVDAVVSTAVLWLHHCRERLADRAHVEGVVVFAPKGRTAVAQIRMSHLNREAASVRLFAVDERNEIADEVELSDIGNVETRLMRCPNPQQTLARLSASVARVRQMVPQCELEVVSTTEVSFRIHGLEFARARLGTTGSLQIAETITFGSGANETPLTPQTEPIIRELVQRLVDARWRRSRMHPLYRMHSERWLETTVKRDVSLLDDRLDPAYVYSQVPAFVSTGRGMIDLLGVTRQGRLAVVELKAEEDLHLPIQAMDYWARVNWLHQRGEFQKNGYFAARELSPEPPLLIMAAPALHVHPTTDTLLRYLSPEIEWKMVGIDERWRDGVRVVFVKRSGKRT